MLLTHARTRAHARTHARTHVLHTHVLHTHVLHTHVQVSPDVFGVWSSAMRRAPRTRLLLLTGVTNARVPYGQSCVASSSE